MYSIENCIVLFILALDALVPLYIFIKTINSKASAGNNMFSLLTLTVIFNALSDIIVATSVDVPSSLIGSQIGAIAKMMALIFFCNYVGEYCNFEVYKGVIYAVIASTLFIAIGVISLGSDRMFFDNYRIERRGKLVYQQYDIGFFYMMLLIVAFMALLWLMHKVIKCYKKAINKNEKNKYILIFIGLMWPFMGVFISILRVNFRIDIISVCISMACVCCYYGMKKYVIFNEAEEAKDFVLDNSVEAIMVVDCNKYILYMNEFATEMLPQLKSFKKMKSDFYFLQENEKNEFELNGRYMESTRTQIYTGKDHLGYLIEVMDMTESINKKKEMEELMQEATNVNKAKDVFLSQMSYEIRTPISAVLGMNEMIIRETENSVIREYAQNIQSAGSSLLSIINDILDFSKIESGELEIMEEKYETGKILENAKRMVMPRLEGKDIKFIMNVNNDLPRILFGDANRIEQSMLNILTNAAKYTERGKIEVNVDFKKIESDDNKPVIMLIFQVKDTGRGIKEEDLKKLFKSFQRVDEGNNRNIEGTGLGLAISRSLIRKMGGDIEVESEYGIGSTFTIKVPQGVIDYTGIGNKAEKEERNSIKYKEKFHAKDAKILVVDDNSVNIRVLQGMLKKTKINITAAYSGAECQELVKKEKFDLIFMDHMMPGMDGIETLEKLKEMRDNLSPDIPVIVLTANAMQGVRELYLEKGFVDYIMKPIDSEILESMLIKYLPKELVELTQ